MANEAPSRDERITAYRDSDCLRGSRSGRVALLAILALALLIGPAAASSLPFAQGIQLIPADEVLRGHTESLPAGGLLFREAGGARVRLITTVDDPEISNRGDGSFHPADEEVVFRALSEIRREYLAPLDVKIFILPYPRSGRLSSSADDRAIYLSPGVRPYEPWQVAYLVTHEIGHLVHRHFLPDSLAAGWRDWAALRGVSNTSVYFEGASHADRPHEIFAEDFRVFFGGVEARGDGRIENRDIQPPDAVPGLRSFYLALAGVAAPTRVAALRLGPNPLRPGDRLTLQMPEGSREKSAIVSAGLYDVSGRRVSELRFRVEGEGTWFSSWDGRDESGRSLATGAYWLRVESAAGSSVLPVRVIR